MDKEKFIENVKNQFEDYEEISLTFDSNFKEIDSYDSLTGMTIMVMLKDEYGVDITDKEFVEIKSIRELYDFVSRNK